MKKMLRLSALVLSGLLALVLVVTACGNDEEEPTATSAPRPTAAPTTTTAPAATAVPPTAAPTATARPTAAIPTPIPTPTPAPTTSPIQTGGTFRSPLLLDAGRLDLYFVPSLDIQYLAPVMNGLIQANPYKESEIIADLAQSWTVSQDGKTYTFKLLPNVKWHDGGSLSSLDVVSTFERVTKPAAGFVSHMALAFDRLADITAPDDLTVVFTLRSPKSSFLSDLSNVHMQVYPASRIPMTDFARKPIGTGPFTWKSYARTTSLELERNANYFKKDAAGRALPYLNGITMTIISDDATSYAAVRTGRLDVSELSSRTLEQTGRIDQLQRDVPGMQFDRMTTGHSRVIFNQTAPWTDQRLRRAVHLAIDRPEIIRVARVGFGTANGWAYYPAEFGGQWGLAKADFERLPGWGNKTTEFAQAQQLIKDSGINPANVSFAILCGAVAQTEALLIQDQLKKLGFDASIRVAPTANFNTDVANGNFTVAIETYGPQNDDPEWSIPAIYLPVDPAKGWGVQNRGKWVNQKVVDLYNQQDAATDPAARKRIAQDLERELIDWAVSISYVTSLRNVAWYPQVKNAPLNMLMFWSNRWRFEQVWLSR